MSSLQEGLIDATAHNWPMVFYEDNVYDPNDRLKGLFYSHAALRVSLHSHPGLLCALPVPRCYWNI